MDMNEMLTLEEMLEDEKGIHKFPVINMAEWIKTEIYDYYDAMFEHSTIRFGDEFGDVIYIEERPIRFFITGNLLSFVYFYNDDGSTWWCYIHGNMFDDLCLFECSISRNGEVENKNKIKHSHSIFLNISLRLHFLMIKGMI